MHDVTDARKSDNRQRWRDTALRALRVECLGLQQLVDAAQHRLGSGIADSIAILRNVRGRIVTTGMGKSGHVARKIAATFSSTGAPAQFVHPADASHGDLGMITRDDAVIAVSNSGESPELRAIVDHAKRFSVPLIVITAVADSSLAKASTVVLAIPRAEEACPNGLAPTTSALMQQALGDALAVALLDDKGFTAGDFAGFHPGGSLGAQLRHVRDVMHRGTALPLASPSIRMDEAIVLMTQHSFGCLGIIGDRGTLIGIITDGDLRRHMDRNLLDLQAGDIMTWGPRAVSPDTLVPKALHELTGAKITSLFVVDEAQRPVGIVHIHDLLRIGAA